MASWKNMELSMKSKPSENKRQSETEMSQTQAMCSLLGVDHRRFLTNSNPYNISGTYEEDLEEWCSRIILIAHLVAYIAVLCKIFDEETKTCPVCRRCIGKVRKLFAA
ncbi:hypothetical protein FEM48_Zijuj08G0126300 [Ziziphus jujuba var. spinosa]|uniref:Uncharacterized protein n=1 Tax=Ziziphus jujuba var. spinosa TaxID=714518 RepID=A0A978UZ55_ZIZJJ|nr:hypothetical protein FEM48_Zijuj08G0126300 [Ziziphus jujuba var. spinosa]